MPDLPRTAPLSVIDARPVIEELQAELERRASPDKKAWWQNYVKGASFRGTPMREIRAAVALWLHAHPEFSAEETRCLALELMREPLSEDKLAGILILAEHLVDELGLEDLPTFRALLSDGHLGDWNSCDWFCVKVLGRMLARAPDADRIADELIGWTDSGDLWVRRAAWSPSSVWHRRATPRYRG